jgi:hypothetical protein
MQEKGEKILYCGVPAGNDIIVNPSNNPVTWFTMAEGQFVLNNITEQNIKYYLVLNALPESSVALIANLVEEDLPADA